MASSAFTDALTSHPALSKRMSFSRAQLDMIRRQIANEKACARPELCIYAAGSLGRLEIGRVSDLDVFLFADQIQTGPSNRTLNRLDEIQALSALIRVNSDLGLPPFSGDGEYLKIHEVRQLLAGTGTSTDDSENLFTTRLLLLLESKCVANDDLYKSATKKIIDMYLRDGKGKNDYRPLFLLNDILRYWRTVCLNYERTRHDTTKPWWKKNLNLKFSRKLTVFSSALTILAFQPNDHAAFEPFLGLTPLERLAKSLDHMDDSTLIAGYMEFLDDYEEFLAAKSHEELDNNSTPNSEHFSATAAKFDHYLHKIFASTKLDQNLVRYMLI